MLLLQRPTDNLIDATINAQRHADLTYDCVGWTARSAAPAGFTVQQWSSLIGNGVRAFERAKDAVRQYRMLDIGWLQRIGPAEPVSPNSTICMLARQVGLYSLNVARIVYVDDQSADRFGFGYGTLPEYPLIGEERVTVDWDAASENVTFEIFSFSRPSSMLMSMGRPFIRRAQRRFCVDASAAMRYYCQS